MELPKEIEQKIAEMFPLYEKPDQPTYALKLKFRNLAAELLLKQRDATSQAAKRSISLALTELETASMYAVKAVHQG